MNKLDFLRRLDKELSVLDKEERKEIIQFYEERFYTGTMYENKTEEEVIAELERPEAIARNVLEEYGVSPKYVKNKEERYSNISSGQVVFLILFDLFVVTWLIPTLFSIVVSLFASVLTYFATLPLLLGEFSTVDQFVFAFSTAAYFLLFLFGLLVLGASIFVTKSIIVWHLNVFKLKNRDKWIKRLSHVSIDGWFKRHRTLNFIKNIGLVASLVTIAYTGLWIFNHFDWVEAEYNGGTAQLDTINEDLSSEITAGDHWTIETDFENMDVEVVLVDGTDVNILHQYYEDDKFTYNINTETNTITLTSDWKNVVFFNITDIFSLVTNQYYVRIEVPESLILHDANINTVNGEVEIRNEDFSSIDIEGTNGDISLSNIQLGNDISE